MNRPLTAVALILAIVALVFHFAGVGAGSPMALIIVAVLLMAIGLFIGK